MQPKRYAIGCHTIDRLIGGSQMIIFIVPTRELVTQQTKSINSQLQLVVKGLRVRFDTLSYCYLS